MKISKTNAMIAVIAIAAATAFTGCKKDAGVTPAKAATQQNGVMDSGGQEPPQPPPPPPNG